MNLPTDEALLTADVAISILCEGQDTACGDVRRWMDLYQRLTGRESLVTLQRLQNERTNGHLEALKKADAVIAVLHGTSQPDPQGRVRGWIVEFERLTGLQSAVTEISDERVNTLRSRGWLTVEQSEYLNLKDRCKGKTHGQ